MFRTALFMTAKKNLKEHPLIDPTKDYKLFDATYMKF